MEGVDEAERLHTSAAFAAASLALIESFGGTELPPNVLPVDLIFGGADALAPSVRGGAFAGEAPNVLPSPPKLSLCRPQQLPMSRVDYDLMKLCVLARFARR